MQNNEDINDHGSELALEPSSPASPNNSTETSKNPPTQNPPILADQEGGKALSGESKHPPLSGQIAPDPQQVPVHKQIVLLPSWWDGIEETATPIFQAFAERDRLFLQDRVVVELARDSEGGFYLVPVTPSALRSRLEMLGRPHARRAGEKGGGPSLRPALCTEDQAKGLLASSAAQRLLPHINVVVSCPIAVKGHENTLNILQKGFNRSHGVLITRGREIPDVPLDTATEALGSLGRDFLFVSKSDCARMMASFISPCLALGGLLTGGRVPITLTVADDSQAGKTIHQKMIAAIYGETPYVIAQRKGGVGGLEESFGHALYAGKPFIQIDNLRGLIDSQYIESFMTADSFTARIPHRQEAVINANRFTVLATSNNLKPTKDLLNRSSLIRIAKQPEDYPFHKFVEGDILTHIKENQPLYLGAVFSIVRAWVNCGSPHTSENEHPFRPWAQALDWIVQDRWPELGPLMENYSRTIENFSDGYLDDQTDHSEKHDFGLMK